MNIRFYQAECGEAARIRFIGTDNKPHNIFIDAGYERTFQHVLRDELRGIIAAGENIDLWVVSHIHDDHIGGVMKYLSAIKNKEFADVVKNWFYNSPRQMLKGQNLTKGSQISITKSIGQGDDLLEYLSGINKLLVSDITDSLGTQDLFGLKITILSPSTTELNRLRAKYPIGTAKMFEREEMSSISEAKGLKAYDYNIPVENFNIDDWREDQSEENGSSIAILTELNNLRVLWLADAFPSVIVKSLKRLGYSKNNPIVCDWVKVTHHGSKGNNSNELYELIRCEKYIMSVNGENKHYLPTKECIARILRNANRSIDKQYHFYFTYDNAVLRNIFKVDGESVFEKYNFKLHYLKDQKWIEHENIVNNSL